MCACQELSQRSTEIHLNNLIIRSHSVPLVHYLSIYNLHIMHAYKLIGLRTCWRWTKRMEWDDQIRGLQTMEQIHILSGDGWKGWGEMIGWEVLKELTKFMYYLLQTRMGWGDQMRDIQKQFAKITYSLKTDDEEGIGWSDDRYSNNWPNHIRTGDGWRDGIVWSDERSSNIDQVHVRTGDGWKG